MLSGFFVSHVQHFYAVIGAAWLPFIILNYYRMHKERNYKNAIYTSLFLFFNLTGGNHTFTFILFYLMLAITGYFIYVAVREKEREVVFQLLKLNALFVALTAALSTVLFVIFLQVRPYIGRLSGMDYEQASANPLSPQSLMSLFVPFSIVNGVDFYNTDPSMCNIYIGILMLPFILLALLNRKTTFEKVLLIFAAVCLFASFGSYTPVHKILFNIFPFINLFRFPSYFSLFTLIIVLIIGGKQLALILSSIEINKRKLVKIITVLSGFVLILLIIALVKNKGAALFFTNKHETIFDFIHEANLYQNIILQSWVQLFLLIILLIVILKAPAACRAKFIMVFIMLDMIIAVQLNISYVGFSSVSPKELRDYISTLPEGFPIPPMNNILENKEELGQKHGLYRNTSVFHKRISSDVFNSFCFNNQVRLIDSFPMLYDSMRHNPIVYFSDDVISETEFRNKSIKITHKTIVLKDVDQWALKPVITLSQNDSAKATITSFSPERIVVKANIPSSALLNLLQSQYTGWKVYIDGQEKEILLSNYLTMSVVFPEGEHTVEFIYKNKPVIIGGIISYIVFIILMIVLSIVWIRENKSYILVALIWLILLGSVVCYFLK